jgi:hypothetical protein
MGPHVVTGERTPRRGRRRGAELLVDSYCSLTVSAISWPADWW